MLTITNSWFLRMTVFAESTLLNIYPATVIRLTFPIGIFFICSCAAAQNPGPDLQPCSQPWLRYVEERLSTGDSQGHGPDPGSMEWRSVVEFKLGIRGDPTIPSRESDLWCAYMDEKILGPDT